MRYRYVYLHCNLLAISNLPGLYLPVLAPYAKSIVGVDVSEGSVARFNKRVSDLGFSPGDFHAVSIKLTEDDALLDGVKFDVVMVSPSSHCSCLKAKLISFSWSSVIWRFTISRISAPI